MRTRYTIAALLLLASALPATAQTVRVDHHDPTYTAGFFDRLQPGAPVADRAGWTWQHDAAGWSQVPTTTPAPVPVSPTPIAPAPASGPAVPTTYLKIGTAYTFLPTGARVFIAGAGQLPAGGPVLFAVCLRAAVNCAGPGTVWLLSAPASSTDFVESTEVW